MQVLSIFVGKVLEFLWKRNAEKHKSVSRLVCVLVQMCALLNELMKKLTSGIGNGVSPGGADWFGVKVALSVNRDGLFDSGADGGIHVVGR